MSESENRSITMERRMELAGLVWLFEILIEEDRRQSIIQQYEHNRQSNKDIPS